MQPETILAAIILFCISVEVYHLRPSPLTDQQNENSDIHMQPISMQYQNHERNTKKSQLQLHRWIE